METLRLDTHFSSAAPDAAGPQGAGRGAAIPAVVYSMHSFTIARPATTLQREEEKLVKKVVVSSVAPSDTPGTTCRRAERMRLAEEERGCECLECGLTEGREQKGFTKCF